MYATQSVMDGNNLAALQAVGQIRAAAASYKNAIDQMESDSENDDPDVQSALAVAQRTANASVIALRAQQDTNNLLSQIANQGIAQSKLTRDQLVGDSNRVLADRQSYKGLATIEGTMGDSFLNWRLQ
jgi:aryl-alcohol dehydrogenase-like predicted oxidoreductase